MSYKLFLDDKRNPVHCIGYMHHSKNHIYLENEWVICRNYRSFVSTIETMGMPSFISFDHDLDIEHEKAIIDSDDIDYEGFVEKTGYDCAKWLVGYCLDKKVSIPDYAVHSMNPVGTANILTYLRKAETWTKRV